ncbi:hypothetical protein [Tranquillimonas alkanivorans]|uniref:VPEID-CTERM protein sorting domain-containing protein n=1 Tax=Tranquillimonas alkanivorans TaxID=441119 RepID=A0A1I5TG49_9RHOB|nr:hypothetical protein [Tranquillimonas alkanivorans]SFP81841.1 hypothetical protein SAMN04488047_113102 [Tranquillimonas alkanivorans]
MKFTTILAAGILASSQAFAGGLAGATEEADVVRPTAVVPVGAGAISPWLIAGGALATAGVVAAIAGDDDDGTTTTTTTVVDE